MSCKGVPLPLCEVLSPPSLDPAGCDEGSGVDIDEDDEGFVADGCDGEVRGRG